MCCLRKQDEQKETNASLAANQGAVLCSWVELEVVPGSVAVAVDLVAIGIVRVAIQVP